MKFFIFLDNFWAKLGARIGHLVHIQVAGAGYQKEKKLEGYEGE